jgi:hypothetical protein
MPPGFRLQYSLVLEALDEVAQDEHNQPEKLKPERERSQEWNNESEQAQDAQD